MDCIFLSLILSLPIVISDLSHLLVEWVFLSLHLFCHRIRQTIIAAFDALLSKIEKRHNTSLKASCVIVINMKWRKKMLLK